MASVLLARDSTTGRNVALKILSDELAREPDMVARFRQEARAATTLDHPNIAKAYQYGEDAGRHYIAFEFIEGETLKQRIETQGPITPAEAVRYLTDLASGLDHAGAQGIVHRDIKPSNIILTPDGRAILIDMGLARHLDAAMSDGAVTRSGMTLGTYDYLSPEQAVDPRQAGVASDLYSLGCTFYHALTGRPPVPPGTVATKLHAIRFHAPPDPRLLNPAIPDDLARVLSRLMRKQPPDRYATPQQLLSDLAIVATQVQPATVGENAVVPKRLSTPVAPVPALAIGGIAFLLILFLIAFTFRGNRTPEPPWARGPAISIPSTPALEGPIGIPAVPRIATV
jgi:serine/threonine protein kinase